MNYYEYAKQQFTEDTCNQCKSFSIDPKALCTNEYCEVRIIRELLKIIDEYKKYDGFLFAHGFFKPVEENKNDSQSSVEIFSSENESNSPFTVS